MAVIANKKNENVMIEDIVNEMNKETEIVEVEGRKILYKNTRRMYKINKSQIIESGIKPDFNNIMQSYKKVTDTDIIIGADGKLVENELWDYYSSGEYYSLKTASYKGEIIDGKIVGSIPQYIKLAGETEFKEVGEMYGEVFSNVKQKLETMPQIPYTVKTLYYTFGNCTNLKEVTDLPGSVTSIVYAFINCTSLEKTPELTDNITNMQSAFDNCKELKEISTLPSKVENLIRTFQNCQSLIIAPIIPENVSNMEGTFYRCTNLKHNNIIIPSSVLNISNTFYDCWNLSGNITINSIPNLYTGCFAGTSSKLVEEKLIINAHIGIIDILLSENTTGNLEKGKAFTLLS